MWNAEKMALQTTMEDQDKTIRERTAMIGKILSERDASRDKINDLNKTISGTHTFTF